MTIRILLLETPQEMALIERLQAEVWGGGELDVVPAHLLTAAVHNGGVLLGAFDDTLTSEREAGVTDASADAPSPALGKLVGFVFGFPGLYTTPDGPRLKHCSHMLAVLPQHRSQGVGFHLKRAQWQVVRHQGLDCITWTYDPLLSRNAHLNIARLGAVCSTYRRDEYGPMRGALNQGLPSDRFLVDWWLNSQRVNRRLGRKARRPLDLAHYLAADIPVINPTTLDANRLPQPGPAALDNLGADRPLLLVEIPADFQALRGADPALGLAWRLHTRQVFEALFQAGYLATDFVHLEGSSPRSFYVFSHGESQIYGVYSSPQPGQE